LRALSERGHDIMLRVPIVPGVNDADEDVRHIGALAAALPHLLGVDILPYHHIHVDKYERLNKVYRLPAARPPSPERMAEITHMLQEFDLDVHTGE